MANSLTGIFVDVAANTIGKKTLINHSYKDWYPLLDCDTFHITDRMIGGKEYFIVHDDEFLLKMNNLVSMVILDGEGKVIQSFLGNIFIANCDDEGDLIDLTEEDIEIIMKSTTIAHTPYGAQNIVVGTF